LRCSGGQRETQSLDDEDSDEHTAFLPTGLLYLLFLIKALLCTCVFRDGALRIIAPLNFLKADPGINLISFPLTLISQALIFKWQAGRPESSHNPLQDVFAIYFYSIYCFAIIIFITLVLYHFKFNVGILY
jgi:hypothetical protein